MGKACDQLCTMLEQTARSSWRWGGCFTPGTGCSCIGEKLAGAATANKKVEPMPPALRGIVGRAYSSPGGAGGFLL